MSSSDRRTAALVAAGAASVSFVVVVVVGTLVWAIASVPFGVTALLAGVYLSRAYQLFDFKQYQVG